MTRSPDQTPNLTSGRLLARNTIWNLLGLLLPLAVGVMAVPVLIRGMGVARVGLLSLAWVVIGYFSLFDLGIGRALTKVVADRLGTHEEKSIPALVWTSLLLMVLLGVLAGLVTWAIGPWLVHRMLKIPEALQAEALHGFYLLATSIPMVTATSGLRGVLEAQQRFRVLSFIRIPMSTFSFAGPLLVLPFSPDLVSVIGVLVAGRLIACVAHLLACFHAMPALRHGFALKLSLVHPLLVLGGWMTVSNIVSPIIVYLDRFLIGALLSVSEVAAYTVPFDMVTRLTIIPGAVSGVLFPAFALSLVKDPDRTALLLSRGVKYLFLAMFPASLAIVVFAPEGLRLWLGSTLAPSSGVVLRWLAVGVFVNCLAQLPFSLIQSAGRPDIAAKVQLLQFLPYLLTVFLLVRAYGIEGAAIAWTARVIVDASLMFFFAYRQLPRRPIFLLKLGTSVAAAFLVFYAATLPGSLMIKSAMLLIVLLAFAVVFWFLGFSPEERTFVLRRHRGVDVKAPPLAGTYP
jgi:O-antigen/teichoic acid export membrane protein